MTKIISQKPIAVANYIIELAKSNKLSVTNLQLQKILFFVQGYTLDAYNNKLIDGQFSKWQYGPVQKNVYHAFRDNGSSFIESPALDAYWDNNGKLVINKSLTISADSIGDSDAFECINKLILQLLKIKAWKLVQLTHNDASWKNHQNEIKSHEAKDYTDDEIRLCYQNNKDNFDGE